MRDIRRKALDRVDARIERLGHVAQCDRKIADLVLTMREVGDFLAAANAPPDADRGGRKPAQRIGDRRSKQQRKHDRYRRRNRKHPQNSPAFLSNDAVDVALSRKLQRAHDDPITLDRHRDGDDIFALLAATTDSLNGAAFQGVHYFLVADAAAAGLLPVDRQAVVEKERTHPVAGPLPYARLRLFERRQLITQDLPQLARIEDQVCITVIDASARSEEHTSELQSRENLVCRLL